MSFKSGLTLKTIQRAKLRVPGKMCENFFLWCFKPRYANNISEEILQEKQFKYFKRYSLYKIKI